MIFVKLFFIFFYIGAFTFGGAQAMLPLIQDAVIRAGWMDDATFIDFVAVSESTPGPFAVNIATFVGMETEGVPGAFFATLGVVLPSFLIILIVAHFYERFKTSQVMQGVMKGLKPAVPGLILAALIKLGKSVFFPEGVRGARFGQPSFWISLLLTAFLIFLMRKKVHPIKVLLIAAACGIFAGYVFGLA